ncbi:MAG: protein kinase [Acidobacteriota bacterium]
MESDFYRRADALFAAALEVETGKRDRFLAERCTDAKLRARVERLLRFHLASTDCLDDLPQQLWGDLWEDVRPGQRIGSYRLGELLGEGGMGAVFAAEREGEFRQRVAIKVLRQPFHDPDRERRFRAERQVLALLEHPGIARVYDGGTTEDGRPYLVLERIEGESIERYCAGRQVTLEQRLHLFGAVCGAVEHAHHNLVVHRDLKPANILVTADGTPKLLDFGIAKLLYDNGLDDPPESVAWTRTGHRLMTPAYASPEQVRGRPITTATDVYALGVILYQLLCGLDPYDLEDSSRFELEKSICEHPPLPPSRAVERADRRGVAWPLADERGSTPNALRRALRGDLDNIVGKALAKVPAERYPSATLLADDLRRHLDGRPVLASERTPLYLLSRALRRHKRIAVSVLALLQLIGAFFLAMVWKSNEVVRERDRARQERDIANQVTEFMIETFRSADPAVSRGAEVSAREILQRGTEALASELHEAPLIRGKLLTVVGRIYKNLGEFPTAIDLLRAAVETLEALPPGDPQALAEAYHFLGASYLDSGAVERAAEPLHKALQARMAIGSNDRSEAGMVLLSLGWQDFQRGALESAEDQWSRALSIFEEVDDPAWPKAMALAHLGLVYDVSGRPREAAFSHAQAHALVDRQASPDPATILVLSNNQAAIAGERGEFVRSREHSREAHAACLALFESEHPWCVAIEVNRGLAHLGSNQLERAEDDLKRSEATCRRTLGAEHPALSAAIWGRAEVARRQGRLAQAEAALAELLTHEDPQEDKVREMAQVWRTLARIHRSQGRLAAAGEAMHQAIRRLESLPTTRPTDLARAHLELAAVAAARGDEDAAQRLLQTVVRQLARASENDPSHGEVARLVAQAWVELGDLRQRQGEAQGAEAAWRRASALLEAVPEEVRQQNPALLEVFFLATVRLNQLERAEPLATLLASIGWRETRFLTTLATLAGLAGFSATVR